MTFKTLIPLFISATLATTAMAADNVPELSPQERDAGITVFSINALTPGGMQSINMASADPVLTACSDDRAIQIILPVSIAYDYAEAARHNIDGARRVEIPQIFKDKLLDNMTYVLQSQHPALTMIESNFIPQIVSGDLIAFQDGVQAAFHTVVKVNYVYDPIFAVGCDLPENVLQGETTLLRYFSQAPAYDQLQTAIQQARKAYESANNPSFQPI